MLYHSIHKRIILPILAFSISTAFGLLPNLTEEIVGQLNDQKDSSILYQAENGYTYLNSKYIVPTRDGIHIQTGLGDYSIPVLFSDASGCYTKTRNEREDSTVYPIIRCINCKKPFSPSFFNKAVCPHCGTKN